MKKDVDIQLCTLFDAIIESIQESARDFIVSGSKDGSIRVTYLPQSELGRKLQKIFSKNARRCELVAPISEDGNLVLEQSEDSSDSGAETTVLSYQIMYDHAILALVLISVYGAISLKNEFTANAVSDAVKAWCKDGPNENGHARLTFIAN